MSKADHGLITSANPTLTRRNILSGGAQIAGAAIIGSIAGISSSAAVPAQDEASTMRTGIGPLSAEGNAVITALRDLKARYYAADGKAAECECKKGEPGFAEYRAALKLSEALNSEFDELVKRLTAEPSRTWDDFVIRAEICRQHCELEFDLFQDEHGEKLGQLLVAMMSISGCMAAVEPEPEVPPGSVIKLSNRPYAAQRPDYWSDYDIVFAGHLIGHFRDTGKAAKYFDVPEAVILGWIRTDYILPAWHPKVFAILEETSQTIAPHILGLPEDALPRNSEAAA
jgi:hypothetical protein